MADKRIKGITIEIGGDTKKLSEALKNVNNTIYKTNTELKDLKSALKLDPKNTELLAQKQELLKNNIKATTERLNTLKETQRQMGDYNSLTDEQKENYRALSVEITKTESSLKNLNEELKTTKGINLDKLKTSFKNVEEISTNLVKKIAKVTTVVSGAITGLVGASIKSYAQYEQLVGGVETLFKDSANTVLKYAQNAYKTAGLSANEYMETVTSFSASLIQSLGKNTQKAAKYADLAITDMSDNANKMGTDISNIQSAYQGFAKQNYTMLDNLKLGYGGTKTEMERLIKDANKVKKANGEMANLSISRFSDMVEAIHIIQNEMGITGTTSKEANTTIEGSINSMKASWKNLLNAISDDNQDMSKSVNNFVDSTITAGKNIVPRIKIAIDGIKKLINSLVREVFPKIKREIPELKPLIEVFEWFIDHRNLVINAIKGIIAAFVVTKIVSFANSVKDAASSLINFATGSTAGMIIGGIGAITGVITLLSNVFNNETEAQRKARLELEKLTDEIDSQIDSWNNLQEAQKNQMNAGMSELSYYEKLYDELKNITDENGNVKKGYETRADFIVSKLSEALGIEIDKEKKLKDQIKGISESIDEVISKKKAEIILDSQKGMYEEALKNEAEASQRLNTIEDNLNKTKAEASDLEAKLIEHIKKRTEEAEKQGDVYVKNIDAEARNMEKELEMLNDREKMYQDSYNKQEDMLQKYIYNKNIYETNMILAHDGKVNEMITSNWEYINSFKDTENAEKNMLEDQIKTNEKYLEVLQKMKKDSNTDMYDDDIKYYEKKLNALKDDLKKYKEVNDKGMKETVDSATSILNNASADSKSAMENYVMGAVQGIMSKEGSLISKIKSMAKLALSTMKTSLQEHSPSKATREMGQYLIEGLEGGINDEKMDLLKQVKGMGNDILSNFDKSIYENTMQAMKNLNGAINSSINPTINPKISYDLNYKMMANVMKDVLKDMKVDLDEREVGRFIDKTVSEKVYN